MALYRPPPPAAAAADAACARLDGGPWESLPGCDVVWAPAGAGFEGATAEGGCTVESQTPGRGAVRVEDSLYVDDRGLRVDDRGYLPDGTLLYGSPDGGPYDLVRVCAGSDLAWTLTGVG